MTQRQAYLKAFPHSKKWKEKSVDENASKLFAQTKVQTRFFEMQKQVSEAIKEDTIASKQEVLEFFTKLMRKEVTDQVVTSKSDKEVWVDEYGNRREKATRDPVIVEITTRNAEAFKGAEALAKHYNILAGDSIEKSEHVTIINDLGFDDEED